MLKKSLFFLGALFLLVFVPWRGSVWVDVQAATRLAAAGDFAAAAERSAAAARRWPWQPDLWAQAGRYWAYAGAYAAADEAFARASAKDALADEDWALWGRVRWQQGDETGALECWQRGWAAGVRTSDLFTLLAQTYARLGHAEAEKQVLQAWLQVDEADAWAHYRLATWKAASLDARALTHLQQAATLDPRFAPYTAALRTALLQALQEEDPLPVAQALMAQQIWPQAKQALEQAIRRQPQNGLAWAWLAEVQQQLAMDPSLALEKALQFAPQEAEVWGLRGMYFSRQNDWVAARDAWMQAVSLAPQRPDWLPSLALAQAQTGDLVQALETYRRATQLAPQEARFWYLLGAFCLEYNISLAGEGLNAALKAFLLQKEAPRYALLVGRYYLALEQPDSAHKYLSLARQLAPADAEIALYWGIWQAQYGQAEAARLALQQALTAASPTVQRQAAYWLETLP